MPNPDLPRVLLVEDEPLIRMLAADMLDALGYVAVEAASGAEALAFDDQVLKAAICLMIDLGLPDMSGEDVVRGLRKRRPDLPVILTTGADASRARASLSDEGSVGVLEKPYQFNDLGKALADLPKVAPGVA